MPINFGDNEDLEFKQSRNSELGVGSDFEKRSRKRWDILVAQDDSGDVTTIADALKLLSSSGGLIYVAEGTYTIAATLSITKTGTKIIGAGDKTIINVTSAMDGLVMIDIGDGTNALSGVKISDLRLDGYISGVANAGTGIRIRRGTNIVIDTVSFYRFLLSGAGRGVDADVNSSKIKITNSEFDTCAYSVYCLANNSIVLGNTATADGGIYMDGVNACLVANNVINGVSDNGIYFINAATKNVISGNYVNNCGADGIEINGNGGHANKNIITGNNCHVNTGAGIKLLNNVDFNTIVGNVSMGNSTYGINIASAACDKNVVGDNICLENTTGQINDAGTATSSSNNIIV